MTTLVSNNYQLMQGDCLELMKSIPDGSVDMILTDPPYGTTACKWDSIIPLEPMWEQLKRIIKPNAAILLFAQTPFDKILGASNLKDLRYEWIWEKPCATGFLNANRMPLKAHENILVFYKKLPLYNPQKTTGHNPKSGWKRGKNSESYGRIAQEDSFYCSTERYPRSALKFNHERGFHPTQKPVALMEYLIKTYTNKGETVLDFTMGSGTTGVAAANAGRNFIGIELDANYFDIATKRIAEANLAEVG